MRILIAPDKFKGSLSAARVAAAIAAGLRAESPAAELVTIPVADGGDGTVDAAVAAGFERVPVTVAGPTGEPVHASYARRGEVAVVELACACGLMLLPGGRREPLTASSFGAGQVLAAALEAGARRIIFGVGGSASTDGGAGLLQALGARALDPRSEPLGRGGAALRDVASLDLSGLHPALRGCSVILATDVTNPLTGPDGAAEVYGPQKGASPAQVIELASGLRRWAAVVAEATGTDRSRAPGAGAAGGVGFAAIAVLGAEPRPGIGLVLDLAGFDAALAGAKLVITGEGSLDEQSLSGKAPVGVARAAARRGIPVVAVAGRSTLTEAQLAAVGISAVYPLSDLESDPARSSSEASTLLERVGRVIALDRLGEPADLLIGED
jgi:glycerate 2-kinase